MKCDDKNILKFLEGSASEEIETHINGCEKCGETVRDLAAYRTILPRYREGSRLLDDLENHMKSSESEGMRSLPPRIAELLKQGGKEEPEIPLAMAAIPRDITRSRKGRKKGERGGGEEK
jgi:hypothetical protein